jgi:hypothetical protein
MGGGGLTSVPAKEIRIIGLKVWLNDVRHVPPDALRLFLYSKSTDGCSARFAAYRRSCGAAKVRPPRADQLLPSYRIVSAPPEPLEAVPPVIYLVVKRTVTNRSGYYMTA